MKDGLKNEFNTLAQLITYSLRSLPFKSAWLNIEMASDVIGIDGEYINASDMKENIEMEVNIEHFRVIRKIKEYSLNHPLRHVNWNKAKFTIYPGGKFNMEYIWDQGLQDVVDKNKNL